MNLQQKIIELIESNGTGDNLHLTSFGLAERIIQLIGDGGSKELTRPVKNFRAGNANGQCYVEVYPKDRKHDRGDIDIFRLVVNYQDEKTGKTHKKELDMTPDEALEIANNLNTATMFWLMCYKPYWTTFMKRKRELNKKWKAKSKLLDHTTK